MVLVVPLLLPDFVTFCFHFLDIIRILVLTFYSATGLVIVLTIPAFYERYEDHIDRCVIMSYRKFQQLYGKLDVEYVSKVRKLIIEKRKLSWFFSKQILVCYFLCAIFIFSFYFFYSKGDQEGCGKLLLFNGYFLTLGLISIPSRFKACARTNALYVYQANFHQLSNL